MSSLARFEDKNRQPRAARAAAHAFEGASSWTERGAGCGGAGDEEGGAGDDIAGGGGDVAAPTPVAPADDSAADATGSADSSLPPAAAVSPSMPAARPPPSRLVGNSRAVRVTPSAPSEGSSADVDATGSAGPGDTASSGAFSCASDLDDDISLSADAGVRISR